MVKIRVGVLRGGPSSEYEVSLKTGGSVLKFLPEKYKGFDVLITKEGKWHINGLPATLDKVVRTVDVVFNALHGEFGEDGKVQHLLEAHKILYTGSGVFSSALAMNKTLSRRVFESAGLKIPRAIVIRKNEPVSAIVPRVLQKIGPWWIVKPASHGSSIGVRFAKNVHKLEKAIEEVFHFDDTALVEEFIRGREATCAVLENFHGQQHYALPVIEIVPPQEKQFFDFEAKYDGKTAEICPSHFDLETKRKIEDTAKKAHLLLGCSDYSRSDMVVSKNNIYLLETNTLPGLTPESLFPKSAEAIGLSFPKLVDYLLSSALARKNSLKLSR